MKYDHRTVVSALPLYPPFAMLLLDVHERVEAETGIAMSLVEGRRTFGRQADDFALGRTKPGPGASLLHPLGRIVTKAKSGQTFHNFALAADSCFRKGDGYSDMPWNSFLKHCHALGLTTLEQVAGLGESSHCEKTWGLPLSELLTLWQRGGYDLIFNRLDVVREVPAGDWKNVLLTLKHRLGVAPCLESRS